MMRHTRAHGIEIFGQAIALADDLGVRIIQLAGYDVYYEARDKQTRSLFMQNLRRCVSFAARFGIPLALKPWNPPSWTRLPRPCVT